MKTFKEFLFKVNFRHLYAVLILLSFLVVTTLPFWIGSKGLDTQAWTYLTASQGALTVLLTLAGRRYFEHKTNSNEQETIKEQGLTKLDNISGNIIPNNTCPNPTCGLQTPTDNQR